MAAPAKSAMPFVIRVEAGQKAGSKTINIKGGDDIFDRYKMRQLQIQVVGKGKMIRTNLINVDDVAKDLKTNADYIGAYIGYEVGAQSKYDVKKPERERASVSGDRDTGMLSTILRKFISEVVLCPSCTMPETTLSVDAKKQDITATCSSCGAVNTLNDLETKFVKYVVAHPPTVSNTKSIQAAKDKSGQSAAEGAQSAPAAASAASASGEAGSSSKSKPKKPAAGRRGRRVPSALATDDDSGGEEQGMAGVAEAAERANAARGDNEADDDDDDDDVDWAVDTSEEAMKARQAALVPGSKGLNKLMGDAESPVASFAARLRGVAKEPVDMVPAKTVHNEIKAIRGEKVDGKPLSDADFAAVLFDGLFSAKTVAVKGWIASRAPCLEPFLAPSSALQQAFLTRLEALVDEDAQFGKKLVAVIKEFYDNDVLLEDAILAWFATPAPTAATKMARISVKPMIDWLRSAAEDDE